MRNRRTIRSAMGRTSGRKPGLSNQQLDTMIAEATVDAHDDDEQLTGFHALIEEHLAVPFTTKVLGVPVSVTRVDLAADGVVVLCVAGPHRQRIPVLDLPLPDPPPGGVEWIEAYRRWRQGRG